ncbi:serine hydrolase [Stenotrophomonas sp. 364]|nr:serine hydrolase [Stenotrophomonas sp. 364]
MVGLPETWQAITIGQLLSHTSGIADYDGDELTGRDGPFYVRRDFTEAELVQKVSQLPVEASPGETWSYRDANYLLLGAVIRSITGKFHGDILAEEIFGRLGMTASRVISDQEIVPHRAAGYERRGGTLYNQAWVSPTFNSTADGTQYLTGRDLKHWGRALCSALRPGSRYVGADVDTISGRRRGSRGRLRSRLVCPHPPIGSHRGA